jgi:hypothetical protein
MKSRWISLTLAIGLALTIGFAFGSGRSTPASADPGGSAQGMQAGGWAGMEAMHDSPAMQRLHAQMPEELRAQCDAMHEQMAQMMGAGGMMSGDMGTHHAGTAGGGMTGSPGGMMAPGSGMMAG